MEWLIASFASVERSRFYLLVLIFFGSYPVVSSLIWITTGLLFFSGGIGGSRPASTTFPTRLWYRS